MKALHTRSSLHREGGIPSHLARCPVCLRPGTEIFMTLNQRRYWRCFSCEATFLDSAQRPDSGREQAEYDQHQNHADDPGYRDFLRPALEAVRRNAAPGAQVLDYGCGPGPALGRMLAEQGYEVSLYDPFYRADETILSNRYDAITCTETAEHFHHPADEFKRLHALLRPGGWLIVMTRFQTDDARFADWHYRRDPTHVVFYRPQTFLCLAEHFGWQVRCTPPHLVEIQRL